MFVWKLIKKVFSCFYDNLFFLIFFNILWFVLVFPLLFLALQGLMLGFLLLLLSLIPVGPLFLSGLTVLDNLAAGEQARFRDLFLNLKKSFFPGLIGFIYSLIVYLILIVDIYFFYTRIEQSYLMIPLAVIIFYLIIFFSMSQLYFWGLNVRERGISLWQKIKKSLLLVLDNMLASFLWLMFAISFTALLLVILPGIPILFFGLIGLTIMFGNRMIMQQYSEDQAAKEGGDNQNG